ncbi:aurora kinase 2 splicing, partial [Colletotrichum cuscutae]
ILTNKSISQSEFIIYNNIIYYSLTKNKRVIRSILILKIYSIVNNINLAYAILIILKRITN